MSEYEEADPLARLFCDFVIILYQGFRTFVARAPKPVLQRLGWEKYRE